MSRPYAVLLPVALLLGVGFEVQAQECGHCHERENPDPPTETQHQMTDDNPKFTDCDGISHGGHDCDNGDGNDWFDYDCSTHQDPVGGCPNPLLSLVNVLTMNGKRPLRYTDAIKLTELGAAHYVLGSQWVVMTGCDGLALPFRVGMPDQASALLPELQLGWDNAEWSRTSR